MSNYNKNDLIKRLVDQTNSSVENATNAVFFLEQAQKYFLKGDFDKTLFFYNEAFLINNNLKKMGFQNPYAHSILLSTDWDIFNQIISKESNYLQSTGWLNSIWKNQPINMDSYPIPWYTYPSIEFIENIIVNNFCIFEYGSGMSTLWWALRVNIVFSIEHNSNYCNHLNNILPKNVNLFLKENPIEYSQKINEFPDNSFDCIIIDGIERCQCVKNSLSKLKDTGFYVFDNTDNMAYDEGVLFLMENGFKRIDFFGMIPCYTYKNCTSIFYKDETLLKQKTLPSKTISCLGKTLYQINS